MSVFEFNDYKFFLLRTVEQNRHVRGYKSRLAEAAGCKNSFISQVLHGHVHLTPEHAVGLAHFWAFSATEREYFLELVNHARSGTPELRAHIMARLARLRLDACGGKGCAADWVDGSGEVSTASAAATASHPTVAYYSTWYHAAIHMLTAHGEFSSVDSIGSHLHLAEGAVCESLSLLESLGLCACQAGRWMQVEARPPVLQRQPSGIVDFGRVTS